MPRTRMGSLRLNLRRSVSPPCSARSTTTTSSSVLHHGGARRRTPQRSPSAQSSVSDFVAACALRGHFLTRTGFVGPNDRRREFYLRHFTAFAAVCIAKWVARGRAMARAKATQEKVEKGEVQVDGSNLYSPPLHPVACPSTPLHSPPLS